MPDHLAGAFTCICLPVSLYPTTNKYTVLYLYLIRVIRCDSTNLANSDGSQPTPFSGSLKSPVELDPPVDNEYQMDAAQLLQSTSLASPHNIGGGVLRSLSRAPPSHEEPTHHARPEGLLSSSSQTLDDIRYKTSSTPTRSDKPHSQSSSRPIVTDTLSRTTSIPPNILPLPTDEVSTIKPTLRLPEEEETVSPPGAHVCHPFVSCPTLTHPRTTLQIYIRRVVRNTAFFQFADKVEGAVEAPFELSNHPDLVAGDLFYHRSGMKCQLWIWEKEAAQSLRWRAIGWGYERKADRKVLILSEKKALPSWVQKSHFLKHTQNHPELQAMVMMPGQ